MTGIRTSREISKTCKENINFMYLLGDSKAPSTQVLIILLRN